MAITLLCMGNFLKRITNKREAMKAINQIFEEHEPKLKELYNELDKLNVTIKLIEEKLSKYPASDFQYTLPDKSSLVYREKRLCLFERNPISFSPIIEKPIHTRLKSAPHLTKFLEAYLKSAFKNLDKLKNQEQQTSGE